MRSARVLLPSLLAVCACVPEPPPIIAPPPPVAAVVRPDEGHLSAIEQLTYGGDNAAPRWSWDGKRVVLDARVNALECMHVTRVDPSADPPRRTAVADGLRPSFLPGDQDLVYAAPPRCVRHGGPFKGRHLDPDLDVVRAHADGREPRALAASPGYDGDPAVCGKDGSIVFTSARDGDLELYRMDADGGGLERLTATVGYDGEAAFDADCSHIVWVASRPHGGDLEDYRSQLETHDLAPRATELWMANADGTDARQITYLDAVSSAPAFFPGEKRVLFASRYGAETSRDVDLWAIDLDGTGLERVTTAPGQDGAPAFSPDGKRVAFTSLRATALGRPDINAFVASWGGAWRHVEERPADHVMGDAAWLADPAREGRGLGSRGLEATGQYLERSFRSFGLQPAGAEEDFRQAFDVTTKVVGHVALTVEGVPVDAGSVRPLGFSSSSTVDGPLVFVGSNEDFAKVDLNGKIAVVRAVGRGSLRHAAWLAHDRGAAGLVVVSEGGLPELAPESSEALPCAAVSAGAIGPLLARLVRAQHPAARLAVTLASETAPAYNVVARYPASAPAEQKLPGTIVVGAHYDHSTDRTPGADDNASGTAALLQIGRSLAETRPVLRRDVVLVAFSGEEQGAAGADAFVKHPPPGVDLKDVFAMIDLDMVGRLRDNTVQVFGEDSAAQWPDLVAGACLASHIECARATSSGFGAADHTSFYEAGVPVLHLFTGVHGDYGKPTDTVDKLNAGGMAQIARAAEQIVRDVSDLGGRLDYQHLANSIETDQPRFKVSLGTIPDRAGPPKGQKGMLLAGVRPGGPADRAGLRKGDVIVRLGGHAVAGVEDVMFVLTGAREGAKLAAVVVRDGKELTVEMTLEATRGR